MLGPSNFCYGEEVQMTRLVYPQEALHMDRPMVLVPLEEYESLLLAALRSSSPAPEGLDTHDHKNLITLLRKIRRERGRAFKSTRAFQQYLKDL